MSEYYYASIRDTQPAWANFYTYYMTGVQSATGRQQYTYNYDINDKVPGRTLLNQILSHEFSAVLENKYTTSRNLIDTIKFDTFGHYVLFILRFG
jgi:hypothetical protein